MQLWLSSTNMSIHLDLTSVIVMSYVLKSCFKLKTARKIKSSKFILSKSQGF